jgi:hypothetical protein
MKIKIYIFDVNKNISIHIFRKIKTDTIEIDKQNYNITANAIYTKPKAHIFSKQYFLAFYEYGNPIPLKMDSPYTPDEKTKIFQIALQVHLVRDFLMGIKANSQMLILTMGLGFIIGIMFGLLIGKVHL